ncbi:MAG TPA: protein kinase [Bryobacteraceae bacterium]|nr:protein kinase [Bryobacteraceae bacterium]
MTAERWRKIEDLYRAAQKVPPHERAALLESTDPDIRARVERMLEVESGSQIFDQPTAGFMADLTQTVVAPGAQLGPYRIEAQIGAGGMGTVYRALDTRLGRVVAIKIAAERYSERFQLEARAISTLNHPNVCTLYDVGPNYLVMEFIDGSTLAAEIRKGPLAPEIAARYGAQIAGALAEAHSLGIVHRDLKPSNVMITRHGVKVLDFGLAKMAASANITETDAVMGTPAYMAPEQVDGREPSSAADLFSLGLVLYEMAVGKLPFPGASLGQMLSTGSQPAVPQPSRERVGVPATLDPLVAKLLEKDPAKRPQSASEVARELSTLADRLSAPAPRPLLRPAYAIPAVAVLLIAIGTALYFRSKAPDPQPHIPNPATFTQLTSFTDSASHPALSPDGRMLAFYRTSSPFGTTSDIWLKLLPNGEPVQITHDSHAKYDISFSPDGARIVYTAFPNVSRLFQTYVVPSLGGNSELFLPNSAGLRWLDDGHLMFSQIKSGIHMGVVTSKPDRSDLREIYFPAHERGMAHYSYLSPDKKWVLLVEMIDEFRPCRVVPFSGGSAGRQVGPDGSCLSAAWSPDGKWIYMTVLVAGRNHLWRQRFPDGKPEQITFGSTEEAGTAVAPDGRSLITSIFTRQNAVWIHDLHGDRALSTEGYAETTTPVFSRDGLRLYYLLRSDSLESPAELWRANLAAGKSAILLPGVSIADYDISDDEKEVVFSTHPPGQPSQIWIAPLDRSAPPRRIAANGDALPHFGPHNEIVFRLTDGQANYVGVMARDGTGRRKMLPDSIIDFFNVSPDRRFVSASAAVPNVTPPPTLILPLDGGPAIRICAGLCQPSWSLDGRYLYLQVADKSDLALNVSTVAIPIPKGETLPRLPPAAVQDSVQWAKVPGVKTIEHINIAPSPNPSVFAYIKPSMHANLFRIPLR